MKINITLEELAQVINGEISGAIQEVSVHSIAYDTRLIQSGENKAFFALKGKFRKGSDFISDAYSKGIRVFVLEQTPDEQYNDAVFITVKNPLDSLLILAKWHRNKFDIPVVAIAGTHGKTMLKEWLGILLSEKHRVVKSPKSFNSKLGVALSLLELNHDSEFGLFEVSITDPGEGKIFQELLNPSHGVLAFAGDKYDNNFESKEDKLEEYKRLFQNAKQVFYESHFYRELFKDQNHHEIQVSNFNKQLNQLRFTQEVKKRNASVCLYVATFFNVAIQLDERTLPDLAMRMESYEGIENTTIINDTYSLDIESLKASLQYLNSLAKTKKKIVLLPKVGIENKQGAIDVLKKNGVDEFYFIESIKDVDFSINNAVILVKGGKTSVMNKIAGQLKLKQHRTKIEINLSAIRKNIHLVKDRLSNDTKCLIMVKANAYGTGLVKVGQYIEQIGADYLGVAYTDEGVELRKSGVKCPILVMNAGVDDFQECIENRLEPSIYSLSILDDFVKILIANKQTAFPIHLKVETGMKRLGIHKEEIGRFLTLLKSQPELHLKGVYSHFAESDNTKDSKFTQRQLQSFLEICSEISECVQGSFIRHISNSDGALNHPSAQLDMVRLGLVVYGTSRNIKITKELTPVINWSSQIAQIKTVAKGESVGYGRAFTANENLRIAIIPVGYADGYRRSLGHGKGQVYVNGKRFSTIGNICMDMIMVDVTETIVEEGELVEIIGPNQSLLDFSELLDTIPYEVLTSLSNRVHRNYIIN